MVTVADLIDYLGQFPPKAQVVLHAADAVSGEDFIVLDELLLCGELSHVGDVLSWLPQNNGEGT